MLNKLDKAVVGVYNAHELWEKISQLSAMGKGSGYLTDSGKNKDEILPLSG
jgi:hypothetical protein